jgi:hypothetical protein
VVLQSASAQTIDFTVLPRPGPYFFAVPAGRYRLAAFEDRNGDLIHQPDREPAVLYGAGAELTLAVGDRREGLDIAIETDRVSPIDLVIGDLAARSGGVAELPDFHLGTIARSTMSASRPRTRRWASGSPRGSCSRWAPVCSFSMNTIRNGSRCSSCTARSDRRATFRT